MINQNVKRDVESKAILSTDSSALNKYKAERMMHRKLDRLENDVHEIQSTLANICDRIDKLENK